MDRRPSYPTTVTTDSSVDSLSPVLDPDYAPQTIHNPNLFFINSPPRMNSRKNSAPPQFSQDAATQLYPYHQQAFRHYTPATSQFPSHPYIQSTSDHRQRSATVPSMPTVPPPPPPLPPPLPPKPILYPAIGPSALVSSLQNSLQPSLFDEVQEEPCSPTDDSNELAMALALSHSESVQRNLMEEQLAAKEEEDLARALAESLIVSGTSLPTEPDTSFPDASSSQRDQTPITVQVELPVENSNPHWDDESSSYRNSFQEFGRYDKWRIPRSPAAQVTSPSLPSKSVVDNEETSSGRRLSFSSASSLPYMMSSPTTSSFSGDQGNASVTSQNSDAIVSPEETVLVFDDEAYARQLAAEEEEFARQDILQYEKRRLAGKLAQDETSNPVPVYQYQSQPPFNAGLQSVQGTAVFKPQSPSPPTYFTYPAIQRQDYDVRPVLPPSESLPFVPHAPVVYPSLNKRQEPEFDEQSTLSHQSSIRSTGSFSVSRYDASRSVSETQPEAGPSQQSPVSSDNASGKAYFPPTTGLLNPNHFLDPELLVGVSIGFVPPAISIRLLPMKDPMPNIISLPYSKCPPLHLQAPDWRHLLRLMARLSGTRIEPTVEAITVSKSDLKLRTVIQFIKPHPMANDWRTILWFTTDVPVPPNVPGTVRYLSNNPNLLPWSYTLTAVPMLLRDAQDTNVSKTFTIPPLEGVPLPTLPITFPNLALYLQAVLDVSRQHSSESAGLGKLGKIVQMCYPNVEATYSEFDIPEKTTVGHLFKRVIGRGNKDKKKGKTTNNEETYQLVTPFVPDEWC